MKIFTMFWREPPFKGKGGDRKRVEEGTKGGGRRGRVGKLGEILLHCCWWVGSP